MEDFLEQIQKNKISIIRLWVSSSSVLELIEKYSLDENLLIKRYAFALLEYYILVVKSDNKSENNYAIIDFIKYLKKHNIKINEFFLLFLAFKDALIDFANNEKIKSSFLEKRVDFYFKTILSELLEIYSKSIEQVESALNKSIDIVDRYVLMTRCDIEGKITSISTAFCKLLGYESFELIGKNFDILNYPNAQEEKLEEMKYTLKSGKIWSGTLKSIKKDGDIFWLKTTIIPTFDSNSNIIGYDSINEDISSNIELENKQKILIEQSKSAAMGEMISIIAHQWRQPLQAISILNQKLPMMKMLKGEISDENLEDVTNGINLQLDYMSKTIDDFRDYFKPNKRKEETKIENILNKSIDFLSYLLKLNSIKINIKNSSNSKIEVFLNEMVQVFINLIKNSCDIMVEKNIEKREIFINCFEKDGKLFVEFEDNGGGISSKIIAKIFDPYFSTKNNKNGTGLGLYMSKTIIEQHSFGKIYVQNSEIGAKFTIELPLKIGE
ncbi:PAS domain-containing sensor histidine kinase [Arcobacter vandammei]|uniref:PAS domain-containing sensor histidine kinase n=1 Tax=Arcobacter vandammei TaxID=2782243 RepID=UPI0018DF87D2|nr:PAS domain-containing sensor histidine kinase [Arcobacter vandammei]